MSKIWRGSLVVAAGPITVALSFFTIPMAAVAGVAAGVASTAAGAYYLTRPPNERREIRETIRSVVSGAKAAMVKRS